MPRAPRIEFEGAIYHVMDRGDRGEPIVFDDADRLRLLDCIAEVCQKTGWLLHAYVLMTNHYHLLLETPEANLVAGMRWFQGTYTSRFNRRHGLRGHLFQGRYKAILIEPEEDLYFLRIAAYIHLNPLRAGLVQPDGHRLRQYPWSSYPYYLGARGPRPAWLRVDRVLGGMDVADDPAGREAYREHIMAYAREGLTTSGRRRQKKEWDAIRRGWCLGSESFRDRMLRWLDQRSGRGRDDAYSGPAVREHGQKAAEQLLEAGLRLVGLERGSLTDLRKTDPRKQALAWLLRKNTAVRNRWVAQQLHMGHEVNVSQAVRQVEEARNGELAQRRHQASRALQDTA